MGGSTNRFTLLQGSGGSFGVHIGQDVGALATDEVSGFAVEKNFTPWFFETNHVSAVTGAHLADAVAEIAVSENSELHPRLDEIGDRRFHAGSAGAGDGDCKTLFHAEGGLEKFLHVAEDFKKIGVEMSDQRLGKR